MTSVRFIVRFWFHMLLLMVMSVTEIFPLCEPVCESYHFSTFPAAIDDGTTHSFILATNSSLFQPLSSEKNMSLLTLSCERIARTVCRLYINDNGDGHFTGNFTCTDLQIIRGKRVILALEMQSQGNANNSCLTLMDSFVFEPTMNMTHLTAKRVSGNTCIVILEGCFPPCCGSTGTIHRVAFGRYRYWPDGIELCYKINISMSEGDSTDIFDENLLPSLTVTDMANSNINLSLMNSDLDNLQNCFATCTTTIDIGRELTLLNYTTGCFSVNATLTLPNDVDLRTRLKSYTAFFTYCMEKESDHEIHIECVGFNPKDTDIDERIDLGIFHSGICEEAYSLKFGTPEIVPCMDKRCQKVASFNIIHCLSLCIENVAADDDAVSLCENVARFALQGPLLTNDNVTIVLEVIGALANTSRPKHITAVNSIMNNLLVELQKEENLHLISKETGDALLTSLDKVLRNSSANTSYVKVDLAPFLLNNLERVMEVVATALKQEVLSSTFEYTGNNAVVFASISLVGNEGDYLFPNSEGYVAMSPVRMKVPVDLLCPSNKELSLHDEQSDCKVVVGSVITRNLPQYLDQSRTPDEKFINSLLLSTLIDSSVDYRQNIIQDPIAISFKPTPLNSNFSNDTCVFWDPIKREWSSDGIYTSVSAESNRDTVCLTTHLTSFAVLVNPKSSETTAEIRALGIVSYIGCAISLACLLASLLIFLAFGKKLNKGVLLYIHINFSISLSLALAVFVGGIETATSYTWICTVIAALLHYLFLCVFCWMLAEGIMLYMLVVRVFGSVAEKWHYLLLLGWGLPLPVVAVSLGIRHDEYGTETYCWLSNSDGTFWAFLGPIMLIIAINCVILVVTVGNMIRSRRKFIGSKDSKNWRLAITAVKSTFILLPLLGLAWIIGPFTLLNSTGMLSWIFAILNSLQGLFFFILHVLRNDKVYDTIKKCLRCIPATVMEKPYGLRGLSSNITLASAESVATASTSEGISQLDCERVSSPPFNIRIYQRKSSEGSATSLSHPTVSVFQ